MFTTIRLLIKACKSLNIEYEFLHPNKNVLKVNLEHPLLFVNGSTPFLTAPILKILKDKDYCYHLFKNVIPMPKTSAYIDPDVLYHKPYMIYHSIPEILAAIQESFPLPVIVKKNSGSCGKNVFLCQDMRTVQQSMEIIFNHHDMNYDSVALVQEYIEIKAEYRAIFLDESLVLLYEKNIEFAQFTGNLSPLHWEGAKALHIVDAEIIAMLENFVKPIFSVLQIGYGGFDIALDKSGKLWLIEINSNPNYGIFIRDNSEAIVVGVFEKMLMSLMSSCSGRKN